MKTNQIKLYPKVNEDICEIDQWTKYRNFLDPRDEYLEGLTVRFKDFYKVAHLSIFDTTVKQIWLEQQLNAGGLRRTKRRGNSHYADLSFGKFTKISVGISHRVLTANFCFTPVATYLIDFFPDFLLNDPFKNPEKYQYPYKNVTLDQLVFVYQMDQRLDLLEESERRRMSYAEFINWAINWALCYNDDIGKVQYKLMGGKLNWSYIKNLRLKNFWENSKFRFDVKK